MSLHSETPRSGVLPRVSVPHHRRRALGTLLRPRRWLMAQILRNADRFKLGGLDITLPDGSHHSFRGARPGPVGAVTIHRTRAIRRLLQHGVLGFNEAYLDGDWSSPDIATLTEAVLLNEQYFQFNIDGSRLSRLLGRLRQGQHRNSRSGSKRNIAYHYDLGNDFYRLWLDESLTYSSAIFDGPEDRDLVAAQGRKYATLARHLDLKPGQSVLEVGCGWGGMAAYLGRTHDGPVTAITISAEQFAHARARIADAGVADRVSIELIDYRDVEGQFDRIVSIEMFEAVGEAYWPTYFEALHRLTRPGGRAALQLITVADDLFARYRRGDDYIRKYIFPGGMLPSQAALAPVYQSAGWRHVETTLFGPDYARTLSLWNQRFQAAWPEIAALGFDATFKRMWEQYLLLCAGSFRTRRTDVAHLVLARD